MAAHAHVRSQQRPTRTGGTLVPTVWRLAAALVITLLVGACSDTGQWRTSPVDAGFPGLAFELTTAGDEVITEADMRGAVTLLFFGYTHCPDVCPLSLARLSVAIDELPDAAAGNVRVLFVSVDPARDDPQRLARYARAFGEQFVGATAGIQRLRALTRRYGSSFRHGPANEDGDYLVSHGSSVLVFDGEGRARLLIRADDGVEAIANDLRRLAS